MNGIGLDIIKLVLDFNDIKEFLVFFGEVCINLKVFFFGGEFFDRIVVKYRKFVLVKGVICE